MNRAATAKAIAAAGVDERYAREYLMLQEEGHLATGAAAGVDGAFWRAKQKPDAKVHGRRQVTRPSSRERAGCGGPPRRR